jgi:hypothetical protein
LLEVFVSAMLGGISAPVEIVFDEALRVVVLCEVGDSPMPERVRRCLLYEVVVIGSTGDVLENPPEVLGCDVFAGLFGIVTHLAEEGGIVIVGAGVVVLEPAVDVAPGERHRLLLGVGVL